jgi:hypothetical protein
VCVSRWTPILTNKAPFVFADLQSVNYPSRFYRACPQEP